MKVLVVGSGPSGVFSALPLLRGGISVIMVDGGVSLEESRQNALNQLKNYQYPSEIFSSHFKNLFTNTHDEYIKLSFGSDYVFRNVGTQASQHFFSKTTASYCVGGLSQVWGASITKCTPNEFNEWPIDFKKINTYYDTVLRELPQASSGSAELPYSPQANHLINHAHKYNTALKKAGISIYPATLAIKTGKKNGCVHCGLCMYGCPYGAIYSSQMTLSELMRFKNFTYQPGKIIINVVENDSGIIANCENGEQIYIDKVILAAGVINTAKIVLNSTIYLGNKIKVLDSQHFIVVAFMFKSMKKLPKTGSHSLTQFHIELQDSNISQYPIQLQAYTHMDLFVETIKKKLGGKLYYLCYPFLSFFLKRMVIFQGYLSSHDSGHMTLQLNKNTLNICGHRPTKTTLNIRKTRYSLMKNASQLGIMPWPILYKLSLPGGSNHYGGTFPMSKNPQPLTTDINGRLYGYRNLHIVDGSVLPHIPPYSPTLTIMANAYRIGENISK